MSVRVRRFGGRAAGRPKRPMEWNGAATDVAVGTATSTCAWLVLPSVLRTQYTDATLMATRSWQMIREGANAVASSQVGIGIIEWNARDDELPTVCPRPISDLDLDWVWTFYAGTAAGFTIGPVFSHQSDSSSYSKARRRLGNDNGILIAFENLDVGNSVVFSGVTRVLLKE